jgi:anti-sigma-K factor RskA
MSSTSEHPRDCEHTLDAAVYVLYALQDGEGEAFEAHLQTCSICREEVAQLQSVTDALAIGVSRVEAPPELGAKIMAAVYPEADPAGAGGRDAERAAPERRWRRGLIPALAATAALAAGLLIGAFAINTSSSGEHTEVIRAIVVAPGHRASADLRKVDGHVQLVVEGLPAPPPGRIYEVWLERGAQEPEPTDVLFSVTHTGNGTAAVPGGLQGISHVLVTDEPLGGSPKPTRKPIIVAKV